MNADLSGIIDRLRQDSYTRDHGGHEARQADVERLSNIVGQMQGQIDGLVADAMTQQERDNPAFMGEPVVPHSDNVAVDRFAKEMKKKLAVARSKGRGGWEEPDLQLQLSDALRAHTDKGDPVDVANFCCFLWNRGEGIAPAKLPPTHVLDVMAEIERALAKFPTWPNDPIHAVAVLGEEFGELTRAVLQSIYEPHKVQPGDVRGEAVQTAAMALRFLASLDRYSYAGSTQHSQAFSEVV